MFAENHAAFFTDFGVDATLNSASVRVIFDAAYTDPLGVESVGPVATLPTADAATVAHGQMLIVASTTYKVRGVEPDGTGITLLRLERQ